MLSILITINFLYNANSSSVYKTCIEEKTFRDSVRIGSYCIPSLQFINKNNFSKFVNPFPAPMDTMRTINLPIVTGGVVHPGSMAYNPLTNYMYIYAYGRSAKNIALCDGTTGNLLSSIPTQGLVGNIAISMTSNKLYYTNIDSNQIVILDGLTNQPIKTIPCPDVGYPSWLSSTNELYITQPGIKRITVIKCDNDSIICSIPVPKSPSALCANPALNKYYCLASDSLTRIYAIDAVTHSILREIPVFNGYNFMVLNPISNIIYCINKFTNNVKIIDCNGDSLFATVSLGTGPTCAVFNRRTNRLYIGHFNSKDIYIVDGITHAIIDIISFASPILSLAFDTTDNRLFAATEEQTDIDWYANLIAIDGTTNVILDTMPVGILPEFGTSTTWEGINNNIWVCNTGYDNIPGYTVTGCDARNLSLRFKTAVGFTPFSAVINPGTGKYYCWGRSDKYIVFFNLNDPNSCFLKETGECAWDMVLNPQENKLYCGNNTGRNVTIINGVNDSTITQVPIGDDVFDLEYNRTDNKIYIASQRWFESYGPGKITAISGSSNVIIDTVGVDTFPTVMLWNNIGNKLYVANSGGHAISILDAHADTILTTIRTAGHPWALVNNTVNDKIYCSTSSASNAIMIIDGYTNMVIDSVSTGYFVYTFAYNPNNNKIYCTNFENGISIIQGVNDSIITTIPHSGNAYSLLYNPNSNTIFCAYINQSIPYPFKDAIMVIDGNTNVVLADFTIDSNVWMYMPFDATNSPSRNALVLDSINNIVYLNHYSSSKISAINGYTGILERSISAPSHHHLYIYPNPARHNINIFISLDNPSKIILSIYDINGRSMKSLDKYCTQNSHIEWDGRDKNGRQLPNGVYFVRLESGDESDIKKIVLTR